MVYLFYRGCESLYREGRALTIVLCCTRRRERERGMRVDRFGGVGEETRVLVFLTATGIIQE